MRDIRIGAQKDKPQSLNWFMKYLVSFLLFIGSIGMLATHRAQTSVLVPPLVENYRAEFPDTPTEQPIQFTYDADGKPTVVASFNFHKAANRNTIYLISLLLSVVGIISALIFFGFSQSLSINKLLCILVKLWTILWPQKTLLISLERFWHLSVSCSHYLQLD